MDSKMSDTTTALDHLQSFWDSFQEMIEDAPSPDECEPQEKPRRQYLFESNGWGAKYCSPIPLRGDEWHAAFESAKAVVAAGGFVAMVGIRGPGKTQMAAEIARAGEWPSDAGGQVYSGGIMVKDRTKTALYRRAMDIFLDLRHAAKNHSGTSEKEVLADLSDVGLLVIDEFQERGESEWENRIIKNLIDKRYASGRPTIVIANMSRKDLFAALGESIVDRAKENGKSIEFTWPSFRQPVPA